MDSRNYQKKIANKIRKHQYALKDIGIPCLDDPMQHLAICNAGQINGLNEETLIESFQQFGTIKTILFIPGKSYCFISFVEKSSAVTAFTSCNGKLNIAQDNKPIFLSYVKELPIVANEKQWNQLPPGLIILENFVTEEQEAHFLNLFKVDSDNGSMKHRQVKHFGYEFRYDINNVDKEKPLETPIPSDFDVLWKSLPPRFANFRPDQLTLNHYKPGQGIPSHIDTHSAFEDPILSLSLGSSVVMEFKKDNTYCVLLPRRSLAIISEESRYDWAHGITPKTFDFYYTANECVTFKRETRISFTFRKVLKGECHCSYKLNCDSFNATPKASNIGHEVAAKLESQHVHQVYEDIAGHFSETRHKPWPNVLDFIQSFGLGEIIVDVGCGNGKYFGHNKDIFQIGTDRSMKLNELCREKDIESFTGNCLNIPIRENSTDGVLSIAVIHHLCTEERRIQAIAELIRILRPGGRALIYVWAKEQVKNNEKSTYIKQDRKNRSSKSKTIAATNENIEVVDGVTLPVHINRTEFNHSDLLVPWKLKNTKLEPFLRFYHVFENDELDDLCRKLENVCLVKSFYDQGNCCVIIQKLYGGANK